MVTQANGSYELAHLQDVENGSAASDSKLDTENSEGMFDPTRAGNRSEIRRNLFVSSPTRIGLVCLIGAVMVFVCIVRSSRTNGARDPGRLADASSSVNLGATDVGDGISDGFDSLADALDSVSDSYNKMHDSYKNMTHAYHKMNDSMYSLTGDVQGPMHKLARIRLKLQAMNATEKAAYKKKLFKEYNITSFQQLKVIQKLHDGNVCMDDEELHGVLCYAKCTTLTNKVYPYRTSAFSCCMVKTGCGLDNTKTVGAGAFDCEGYNVAGALAGGVCPHSPGACLATEEFRHNVCYKKCSLLTFARLPYREAANTCCVSKSSWGALDLGKCSTKPQFAVGGGDGDGKDDTPKLPHPAIPEYTEMPNKTNVTATN